jgi:hypothetical protein
MEFGLKIFYALVIDIIVMIYLSRMALGTSMTSGGTSYGAEYTEK